MDILMLNMNGSCQKCKTFCESIRRICCCVIHRELLKENFESLGSSPAACGLWIAAMEVAISAAEHARRQDDPSSHRLD
eukprot:scaffold783_cov156-Skeletonema_marinoi.AAC.4